MRDARMASLAPLVDWVEVHNARLVGSGNERAAEFAAEHGLRGVAVTDAHTVMEVGVAYTVLPGDPSTAAGMLAALANAELVRGRASYAVRLWTPVAKLLQQARGNPEQCRLARAIAADQADPFAGRDGEPGAFQQRRAAETERNVAKLEKWR